MYLKPIWIGAKIIRQAKLDFYQLLSSLYQEAPCLFSLSLKKWSSLIFILFAVMVHF